MITLVRMDGYEVIGQNETKITVPNVMRQCFMRLEAVLRKRGGGVRGVIDPGPIAIGAHNC